MRNVYETSRSLEEYLLFHYGNTEDILPFSFAPREALDFAIRTVSECLIRDLLPPRPRALDVGCAVGRSSFELARHCHEVNAVDFSSQFIKAARSLQNRGSLEYRFKIHGQIYRTSEARIPDGIEPNRVTFEVGDAHNLSEDIGGYDVVHAANLLCRMVRPAALLSRFPSLVVPGGQLIITSPYTWDEEFTPPENWVGATADSPDPFVALEAKLSDAFRLERRKDLPFLIREHARKFQWGVAEASVWIRQ